MSRNVNSAVPIGQASRALLSSPVERARTLQRRWVTTARRVSKIPAGAGRVRSDSEGRATDLVRLTQQTSKHGLRIGKTEAEQGHGTILPRVNIPPAIFQRMPSGPSEKPERRGGPISGAMPAPG
jgi:hypothetical protein